MGRMQTWFYDTSGEAISREAHLLTRILETLERIEGLLTSESPIEKTEDNPTHIT